MRRKVTISNIDFPKSFSEAAKKNCGFVTDVHHILDFVHDTGANFGILGNARIEGETVISINLEESRRKRWW